MKYEQYYERNIGIFSKDEQDKIRKSVVFVAGVGGAGGNQAAALARMGIGELIIMDPGVFDEPDFNRQFGAKKSSLHKNKALETAKILEEIAPFTKITTYSELLDEDRLHKEIKRSNLVVDAIDLAAFDYKVIFERITREEGKYSLSAPIPDLSTILITFSPDGMTFEEYTHSKQFPPMTLQGLKDKKNGVINKIPFLSSRSTLSSIAFLSAAVLATEVALILTGKLNKENIVTVPYVKKIDLFTNQFKIFNPLEEEITF